MLTSILLESFEYSSYQYTCFRRTILQYVSDIYKAFLDPTNADITLVSKNFLENIRISKELFFLSVKATSKESKPFLR